MWARIVMLAVVATGCYSPTPSPGAPCGPGDACPTGLRCSAGLCLVDEQPADGPITPDDTPAVDAPAPVWELLGSAGVQGDSLMFPATTAGTTIVVAVETSATTTVGKVEDNAGNVYELIPGTRARNFQVAAVEIWMANNATAGATEIRAFGSVVAVVAWEIANLAADPVVFVDTLSDQDASTKPVGVSVTTTAPGQFVVSVLIVQFVLDGLVPGSDFTNDHTTLGNGWAHLTNNDAPAAEYQPQWSQPTSGTACGSSVVFRTN